METLAERLADKERTELHPTFVAKLRMIANNEGLNVDVVWNKWKEYAKQCYDQSPIMFEFCQWNKFKVIQ